MGLPVAPITALCGQMVELLWLLAFLHTLSRRKSLGKWIVPATRARYTNNRSGAVTF